MSEIERFKMEFQPSGEVRECVYAEDFDAQRLRADTAEAESRTERLRADAAVGDANEAERKLAASEQRIADISEKLSRALELLRGTQTGDLFGPDDWEMVSKFLADAALNQKSEGESHE